MTIKDYLENKKEELKEVMNPISKDFAFDFECSDSNSYINDCFTEYADSQVDIYTNDLLEWVKGNYSYIEDYVKEFGQPEKFDFIHLIQCGQFYEHYQNLYRDEDEIKALIYVLKLLQLDDAILEQELDEELESNIDETLNNNWCDIERFDQYEDIINSTLGWE